MVTDGEKIGRADGLGPYVSRVAAAWPADGGTALWRPIKGSLLFVDISGFTNLSERLARRGRIGAEELTSVLDRIFGRMLEVALGRGGSLLKFGGDALLILFDGEEHVIQACAAAVEMRSTLREAGKEPTSVGRINLKMSSGIDTGAVDFFLVGSSHRELLVTGPVATRTAAMEKIADAGEIVVSDEVRGMIPGDFVGAAKGSGWLLRKTRIHHPRAAADTNGSLDQEISILVPRALREHLATGVSDSEHRIATIGFIRFAGIDSLLAKEGPESVAERLEALLRSVEDAADAESVTFLASDLDADGGKIVLATGVPVSQHDDEGRMLRSLRRIIETDCGLDIRIGVNRGHVFSGTVGSSFRRTYTVMGDTVNLAARLMAAASPGMVYSTPSVLDNSSTLFRTEALEPFKVKGKDQEVQAYAVFEETGVRPPDLAYKLPFHGRETERDLIVQTITTCARIGNGGMMTIVGDVGLGKTRLVAEVLEECPGLATLLIQAEPYGADNPYWAFRDPMLQLLRIERGQQAEMTRELTNVISEKAPSLRWAIPLLGDVMHIEVPDNDETAVIGPKFRPDRTAEAVIELLTTLHSGPLAIVGEDGHWMDEASIGLLRRIGEAAQNRSWSVIFTARPGKEGFEPLGEVITLRPLDDEAVRSIAIEATTAAPLRPDELDAIVNRVGGNPLFLSAILDMNRDTASAEQLPDSLDAVVSQEIDTLPTLTRLILRYTSVLGRSFSRVVLDEFLAPDEIRLDEATQDVLGRFIEVDGFERIRFRHSVVRDVAYGGLSYRRRRELHSRAGEVIERLAGDDPESIAEFLSYHYSESGSYEKAWHYARIAADRAKRTYANAEAATQYRRALEAAKRILVDDEERARVQEAMGDVLDRLGAFDEALASYRRAQHSYRDPKDQAKVLSVQAAMLKRMGEYSRALRTLTRGLNLAQKLDVRDVATDILAERAAIRLYQGRYQEALVFAERALANARDNSASPAVALAEITSDWARTALGRGGDHASTWRAFEIAEALGDLHIQGAALNNLGMYAYYAGDWDQATDLYARGRDSYQKTGDAIAAAYGEANTAEILSEQGHLDDAETHFSRALTALKAAGDQFMAAFVLTHLGRIRARRGDIDTALQRFDEALGLYESMGAATEKVEVALRRAEALVFAGRGDEAGNLLEGRRELAPEQAPAQLRPLAYRVQGLRAWASGDEEIGLRLLSGALDEARDRGSEVDELAAIHSMAATGTIASELMERASELCLKLGIVAVPVLSALRSSLVVI